MSGKDLFTVATLLAFTSLAPAARAAEHVTLRNGFEMDCHHHTQVKDRVRLYLSPGEESYIDFAPENITGVEIVPDPPVIPPPASAEQSPAELKAADSDPKLNPADLHEMLTKAGHERNLDVALLASLVKAESGGNARAVSSAGARGLMQLMPGTANDLGVQDSFEPGQNVRGGSAYLDWLLTRYHDDMQLALAAYNAGPAAVDKYHGIPPYHETKVYVARVIHEFNRRVREREAEAKRERATSQN